MSLRAGLGFGTSIAVLLVACGGNLGAVGVDKDGDDAGADGGEGGGGDGETCTTTTLPGDRACVPGLARANVEIEIAVDASDGCLGCFTTFEPCKVEVGAGEITVSMVTKTCPPAGGAQPCPAMCAIPSTRCKLPPLAEGTYRVKVTGEGPRTGQPPRQLVVTSDATASAACNLPPPGTAPSILDGTQYATSCSVDADCALATFGNVCIPCSCPNAAIAKSSSSAYEADVRARTSQCREDRSGPVCAACPPAKATCLVNPTALTGTCRFE